MFENVITDEQVDMLLRQNDAETITTKTGHIGRATFGIEDDNKAVYQYAVTEDGDLYLHRMDPDPFSYGKISDAGAVVKNIAYDLANYRRAAENGVYDEFIHLSDTLTALQRSLEELFLMYDPQKEEIEEIYTKMTEIHEFMKKVCEK